MEWYDEDMPDQDDGYERYYYPERFKNKQFNPLSIEPNSIWMHHNGITYQVLHIANEDSTNPDYPETIVYKGGNGKVWAKLTENFLAKMTKLDVTRNLKK